MTIRQMKESVSQWWGGLSKNQKLTYGIGGSLAVVLVFGGGLAFAMQRGGDTEPVAVDTSSSQPQEAEKVVEMEETEVPTRKENSSPFSGVQCSNHNHRPIGVMLASDNAARPLSGMSQAEIVVEMPVITGSVTRLLGLFQCNFPTEVGSVRSARHDYISLMRGWDGIFAHWGGSHFALDEIASGVRWTGENLGPIDNVDGRFASGATFRKSAIPAPHNAFFNLERVIDYSKQQGYSLENTFEGYSFLPDEKVEEFRSGERGTLYVGFGGIFATSWKYDPDENQYVRYWSGQEDRDRATGSQVTPENIVVFKALSQQIEGQYNTVGIYGEGEAWFYMNGKEIKGTWKKEDFSSPLLFEDEAGYPMRFVPGQTFIQVIEPSQQHRWEVD